MAGRKKQGFSFLEKALKAAGGNAAPGSRLGNYKEFKEGRRKKNVTATPIAPELRKRYAIALVPFNLQTGAAVADEDKYRATITLNSSNGRKDIGLTDAVLGYSDINAANQTSSDYEPASLILFVTAKTNPEVTKPPSGITGQKYSRTEGKSYTAPFGRSLTSLAAGEQERRVDIATIAKAGGASRRAAGISYNPEYWGAGESQLSGLPA